MRLDQLIVSRLRRESAECIVARGTQFADITLRHGAHVCEALQLLMFVPLAIEERQVVLFPRFWDNIRFAKVDGRGSMSIYAQMMLSYMLSCVEIVCKKGGPRSDPLQVRTNIRLCSSILRLIPTVSPISLIFSSPRLGPRIQRLAFSHIV